jgi:hypothetical protein
MVEDDDAQKSRRDKLLDDLKKAYDEYYKQEIKRVNVEEQFIRALQQRGGSRRAARANAKQSKLLLVQDISTFLTG